MPAPEGGTATGGDVVVDTDPAVAGEVVEPAETVIKPAD